MFIKKFKDHKQYRLPYHDYSSDGYYFVTICTKNRENFFGEIRNGIMALNEIGCIAAKFWQEIQNHFENVKLDTFQIMPNHLHGILVIEIPNEKYLSDYRRNVAMQRSYGEKNKYFSYISPKPKSVSAIIRSFKSIVTKTINLKYPNQNFAWQSRFWDRVIRNEDELNSIQEYILFNPIKWEWDRNNLKNLWM